MRAGLALLLAFALVPRLGRAAEPTPHFAWRVPEGCPARAEVLARAEKLLGRPLTTGTPVDVELDARVTHARGEPWRLQLQQRSSGGTQQRQVTATSCDELADAAALFLALSIDPSLANAGEMSASASFPSEQSAAVVPAAPASRGLEPPPDAGAATETRPEPEPGMPARPPRLHVGLSFAIAAGRMPGKAAAGVLHAGVSLRSWLWLAELSAGPEQRANAPGSAAGGDLGLLGLGAGVAYLLDLEPMTVGPAGGLELGWLRGTGTGVENPTSADALLLGFHAGLRCTVALSRELALLTWAAGSISANRPRFVLDGIGTVHQPDRWGWRLGVGMEWHTR